MEMLDEIVSEFLVESHEGLDQLDRDLMALEENPVDRDRISSIFRAIHSIKGTSGFLALPRLEKVAHVGESLLVPLRDGKLSLNTDIADALLAMVDAIRSILECIESAGNEGDNEYTELIARLEALKSEPVGVSSPARTAAIDAEDIVAELTPTPAPKPAVDAPPAPPEQKIGSVAESTPAAAAEHKPEAASNKGAAAKSKERSLADSSVRIDVHLLDKLMNLVGELVLARNQVMQVSQELDDPALATAAQRVNLIMSELQEGVMKTRMQPISNAWAKLPRVVRDLANSCGKQVQVVMEGAETELDKTILEAIKDPLTHIVRNSVDHGIETPDIRAANGKPTQGTLWLRAYHEGGRVNIEIADNGGGISLDRVRKKAVEKGLVTAEQAAAMSDHESTELILLPGFSTAATVTNVSGRGVGMDVVKTNVEMIGGTLEIETKPGHGTTLRIKIPLTLAIIPALIVTSDKEQYAVPQVSVLELIRLNRDEVETSIEYIQGAPVYRLRGKLLPLIFLKQALGTLPSPQKREQPTQDEGLPVESGAVNIAVLRANDREYGLVVDKVNDFAEIVVKPLSRQLKGLTQYAGTTIMGDGSVALILDVMGIAVESEVTADMGNAEYACGSASNGVGKMETHTLLVVDVGDGRQFAIPTSIVTRLENIPSSAIERSDSGEVLQYRGDIMPIVRLGHLLGVVDKRVDEPRELEVIVYSDEDRSCGFAVHEILDIVDAELKLAPGFEDRDSRLLSTTVIHNRVTDVLNLRCLAKDCLKNVSSLNCGV